LCSSYQEESREHIVHRCTLWPRLCFSHFFGLKVIDKYNEYCKWLGLNNHFRYLGKEAEVVSKFLQLVSLALSMRCFFISLFRHAPLKYFLTSQIKYVSGSYDTEDGFQLLDKEISQHEVSKNSAEGSSRRLFYLALPPSVYPTVCRMIRKCCMNKCKNCWSNLLLWLPISNGNIFWPLTLQSPTLSLLPYPLLHLVFLGRKEKVQEEIHLPECHFWNGKKQNKRKKDRKRELPYLCRHWQLNYLFWPPCIFLRMSLQGVLKLTFQIGITGCPSIMHSHHWIC